MGPLAAGTWVRAHHGHFYSHPSLDKSMIRGFSSKKGKRVIRTSRTDLITIRITRRESRVGHQLTHAGSP
jgi:hypothetical protein